jgi:hypothetical protein
MDWLKSGFWKKNKRKLIMNRREPTVVKVKIGLLLVEIEVQIWIVFNNCAFNKKNIKKFKINIPLLS